MRAFLLAVLFAHSLTLSAAWSPPMIISDGPSSINATNPISINSRSVALVGWLNGQLGTAQSLFSAGLSPSASQWTSPLLIYTNSDPNLKPAFPLVLQDRFDNKIAAFGLLNFAQEKIVLNESRRPPHTGFWPAPITQNLDGLPPFTSVASDTLGNLAILFGIPSPGVSPPYSITLTQIPADSSSWLPPILLDQDNSVQPAVAAKSHEGHGVLIWKVNSPSLQLKNLRYNFLNQQSQSVNNIPLPPSTSDVKSVEVAVDAHGNAIAVYSAQIGSETALYSSTLLAGKNRWSQPVLISDPSNSIVGFSIATDASGTVTVVWGEEIALTRQFIRAATLPLSKSPTFITDLTNRTATLSSVFLYPHVVVDKFGNAVAIWTITVEGASKVQVAAKVKDRNWRNAVTLSNNGAAHGIALSDQGTAVAIWIDSITNILMSSRNLFLFNLEPPRNFIGEITEDKFLTETAHFLEMQWKRSRAPNIVRYELFKNGILIATLSENGPFKFRHCLHSNRIEDTYTLVAIASNGNRSVPIKLDSKN